MAIGSYPSPPSETTLATPNYFDQQGYLLRRADRRVRICIKDGHDTAGAGMTCEMALDTPFTNVFARFKASSCTSCRAPDEMRFKKSTSSSTRTNVVSASDTPATVGFRHGNLYAICVWSNVPGLQCADCQSKGYPETVGVDTTLSTTTAPICTNSGKSETITLLVKDLTGFEMSVKMLNTTPFDYLIETYTARALRHRIYCRFLFESEVIVEEETPKQLGLINNDIISVYVEQIGG